jgi:hypothetical protein
VVWKNTYTTTCYLLFVLLPVLRTIFQWLSWVIFLLAALAASWWTDWCLSSCCVPMSDVLDEEPANQLDLDPL